MRKNIPDKFKIRCQLQTWEDVQVKSGLKEGRGVVANKVIEKGTAVCNYGGHFLEREYAEKYLLPFEEKCEYLLEMKENFRGKYKFFYLNHDDHSKETFGKYLNHSKKHPNVAIRIYADDKKLDVIFVTSRKVKVNEQLVWNYGTQYKGVGECVESCEKCRSRSLNKIKNL